MNGRVWAARLLLGTALALGLPNTGLAQTAGPGQARLTVKATILKHASLKMLAQPSALVVTPADIARGYVDVPLGAQVAVQSNSPGGYLLEFAAEGEFMRRILVRGLGSDVQLSRSGGFVAQRPAGGGMSKATLALGFRFFLSDSVRQGTYPWPMRLSVAPL